MRPGNGTDPPCKKTSGITSHTNELTTAGLALRYSTNLIRTAETKIGINSMTVSNVQVIICIQRMGHSYASITREVTQAKSYRREWRKQTHTHTHTHTHRRTIFTVKLRTWRHQKRTYILFSN